MSAMMMIAITAPMIPQSRAERPLEEVEVEVALNATWTVCEAPFTVTELELGTDV